jgi:hypothetical protein
MILQSLKLFWLRYIRVWIERVVLLAISNCILFSWLVLSFIACSNLVTSFFAIQPRWKSCLWIRSFVWIILCIYIFIWKWLLAWVLPFILILLLLKLLALIFWLYCLHLYCSLVWTWVIFFQILWICKRLVLYFL